LVAILKNRKHRLTSDIEQQYGQRVKTFLE